MHEPETYHTAHLVRHPIDEAASQQVASSISDGIWCPCSCSSLQPAGQATMREEPLVLSADNHFHLGLYLLDIGIVSIQSRPGSIFTKSCSFLFTFITAMHALLLPTLNDNSRSTAHTPQTRKEEEDRRKNKAQPLLLAVAARHGTLPSAAQCNLCS